ncbi:MAG: hypothetical protein ACP5PX_01415 [Candidatus Hadarchaeum sp.]|uniref:hypothetical protein n=1 Tax=Candidatus Hadarchaeum sp. TaxID=2883567 RepID=UPI003D1136BC
MLLTTSRRPCHLARILGRELARLLPDSEYVPRGVKTIEKVAALARQRGHHRVIIINSSSDRPSEMRFLEVGGTWQWLNASMKLAGVAVNRVKIKGKNFGGLKIYAGDPGSFNFSRWLSRVLSIECTDRLPESGPVVLLTSDGGLKIRFRIMPCAEEVGPVLSVASFGPLFRGANLEV